MNSAEDIGSLLSLPVRILDIELVERFKLRVEGYKWINLFTQLLTLNFIILPLPTYDQSTGHSHFPDFHDYIFTCAGYRFYSDNCYHGMAICNQTNQIVGIYGNPEEAYIKEIFPFKLRLSSLWLKKPTLYNYFRIIWQTFVALYR